MCVCACRQRSVALPFSGTYTGFDSSRLNVSLDITHKAPPERQRERESGRERERGRGGTRGRVVGEEDGVVDICVCMCEGQRLGNRKKAIEWVSFCYFYPHVLGH